MSGLGQLVYSTKFDGFLSTVKGDRWLPQRRKRSWIKFLGFTHFTPPPRFVQSLVGKACFTQVHI